MSTPSPETDRYEVRLLMVNGAESPVDAVEEFIGQIVDYGLRGFLYRVRDTRTDEVFLVQEQRVTTEQEVLDGAAALAEAEAADEASRS